MAKQALAVLAFLCVSFAFAKDKTSIPKQIVVAKYVLVTTYFGDNLADSRVPQVDRQAANDVMDAIRDWGRYTLVYERKAADLIILVRKGRRAETREGVDIHAGSSLPKPEIGPVTEIDGGDPADMIAVYDADRGINTAPLWRERMSDGLDPPVKLVGDLRKQVEVAAKKP